MEKMIARIFFNLTIAIVEVLAKWIEMVAVNSVYDFRGQHDH